MELILPYLIHEIHEIIDSYRRNCKPRCVRADIDQRTRIAQAFADYGCAPTNVSGDDRV